MNVDLLNLLGRSYVIDNCTAFLKKRNYERQRDYYETDMMYLLVKYLYGKQADLPRFADGINKMENVPQKSAKAVRTQIKGKMRNLFKEN